MDPRPSSSLNPSDPLNTITPNMVLVRAHDHAAAKHIAARDAQLPADLLPSIEIPANPSKLYRQLLSPREVEIVELDATGLAAAIAAPKYTSAEVTEAYLKSALGAHAGTKCLAWFDATLARERAKWLDEQMELSGPVGPLHGVPMSVKGELRLLCAKEAALILDFMCVKGFTQSSGHLSSAGYTPEKDADMTAIFRAAGVGKLRLHQLTKTR